MSSNPRAAYATIPDAEAAILVREAVEDAQPSGDGYTDADFDRAQGQLKIELRQVGKVRDYLADLAAPFTHTNAETWEDVRDVSDQLRADLKVAKEDAAVGLDPFALIEALLDFAGAFAATPSWAARSPRSRRRSRPPRSSTAANDGSWRSTRTRTSRRTSWPTIRSRTSPRTRSTASNGWAT